MIKDISWHCLNEETGDYSSRKEILISNQVKDTIYNSKYAALRYEIKNIYLVEEIIVGNHAVSREFYKI